MRFERLDLNLLVALNVLIEERSVSAAAKRLNLSQPAVSGALNRLRAFFGDDLLVQLGRQMVLTPKAEELTGPVRDALMLIRTRITTPVTFDPTTAERTFHIIASDYVFTVLLADVLAEIARVAPGICFEILPPEQRTVDLLERGEIDLLLTVESHLLPGFQSLLLFEDEHAVVCWAAGRHAIGLDAAGFFAAEHAIAVFGPARLAAFSESYFERQRKHRRIAMRVPSFTMLPQAVIGTDRLATMQRRYADHYARFLPIVVLPTPFDMPRLREMAQWHPMRDKDPGLRWLLDLLAKSASWLSAPASSDAWLNAIP